MCVFAFAVGENTINLCKDKAEHKIILWSYHYYEYQ